MVLYGNRNSASVKTVCLLVLIVIVVRLFHVAAFAAAFRKCLSACRPLVPVPGEAHDDECDNEPDKYHENDQDNF